MKIVYRIPHPTDPYAFVEVTHEPEPEVAIKSKDIRFNYDELKSSFKDEPGLTEKDMDLFLDAQLSGDGIRDGADQYAKMSPEQQKWCQRIKRAIKRIKE